MTLRYRPSPFIWPVWTCFVLATLAVGVVASPAYARISAPGDHTEMSPTKAGAIAADKHWSLAEETGDVGYLDQFLLSSYRSVNADGSAYSKAQIIRGAAKRRGTSVAEAMVKIAAYRENHPYKVGVVIQGNTAILSFYEPLLGLQKGTRSSDVLVYFVGRWHAMYSQHSSVSKSR